MNRKLLHRLLAAVTLFSINTKAQSPGGVSVTAWYRADAAGTLFSDAGSTGVINNSPVYQWNEAQGNGWNLLQSGAASRPVYGNASVLANFNPTVTFDGSNDWMQFTAGTGVNIIDRASGTLYAAGYINTLKRSGFTGFNSSMDYPGLHVFADNNKVLFFTGGPGYQGLSSQAMTAQSFFATGAGWLNGGGSGAAYAGATVSLNGTRVDYTGAQLNNANLATTARDFRIGADNNYGSFSGQLNEVLVFEDKLTTAQMDQVEAYLAVKYGTTYAAGTRDYKNSLGTVVWTATTNTGWKNNIAGIARDDNGALYQKQSWSTSTGRQVLIGMGTLANTNAANTATMTNGQYLIWGDNGLPKAPTVTIAGITGISHRFAATWKVQNTSALGTVRVAWVKNLSNLSLIQSTDTAFTSADVITNMTANEVTINGVVYNYADVTLTNGQYFTFAAKLAGPGGVTTGLLMWHRADDGTATAGAKNIWKDMSGNGRDVTQNNNAAYQPTLVTNAAYSANSKNYNFNFNPFYYLDGTNDFFYRLNDSYFPTTTSPGSTYGVMFNSTAGGYNTPYGWGDDDPNLSRVGDNYQFWRDNGLPLVATSTLTTKPAHIGSMMWKGSANGLYLNIDGQISTTTSYNIGNINSATPPNFAIGSEGYNLAATGYELYQGGISEVFAYNVDHQNAAGDEKKRINSYLAIKYGITLKSDTGAATPDYLSSASAIIWNATTNAGYNSNIAGLANDDNSALNQKQSRSNSAGQQVLIGTTGLANTNALNITSLSNGQFLVWGDNGLGKSLSLPFTGVASLNLRFAAIWKVQNTGTVSTVRVAWPSGIPLITLVQSADAVFDATDTRTDMSVNTQVVNGVAYNYADVTLSNGQYFTFAGYIAGPGGVGQDLSLWYRADNGVETDGSAKVTAWNNSTSNDVKLTMSGAAGYLPYNDQTTYTKTWNFNPTLSFDGTNNYLRNNSTAYLNTAGSVHYIAVARNPQRDANARSLFAIAGNDDGFFYSGGGGNTALPAIGNNYNTTASAISTSYNYGIYSAILPKTGSPANQRGFYNGLMKVYASPYPVTGASYSLPTTGAYVGADGTTGDNFNGEIAEVILYHNTTGGDMLNADLSRIHSYLAIKYGITLDQTTAQHYFRSDSGIVWNAGTNTGYGNNIAGIARDDQGGLYQKQSKSVNAGRQVLISTTGLANTNATNAGVLSNNQFLLWGDNNRAKGPVVAIAGITSVNYRFAALWKVQNTGTIGTVRVAWPKGYANLKLIQSADTTINSSDVVTDMTASQVVNGQEYAYADVTLTDGQYFTFAAFIQAPGGVTNNLSYWYRADKFAETIDTGASVTSWTDFTSGTAAEQLGDNAVPVSAQGNSTYFNYNPGIKFTAANQTLGNIDVQTVTNLNYDIFTLTKEGVVAGGNGRIFSSLVNNTDLSGSINYWDGIGIMADQRIERMNTAYSSRYLANPGPVNYATTVSSIMYTRFTDLDVSKGLNGAASGAAGTHIARGQFNGGHAFGSTQFSGNGSDNAGFTGDLGEVIVYGNGNVTATERNKVESYLAIKYGITLNNSNNYTTSQNVVVWDAAANTGYYNNVAGVGNDYISALHQKQSRSQHVNANGQVIMGLSDIAATNLANTDSLTNGQFLVWGDNGSTVAMTNTATTFTAFNYAGGTNNARRMKRSWKVQNTGVSKGLKIRFPKASVGTTTLPSGDACGAYAIVYASDTGFTTNVTAIALDTTDDGLNYETIHSFPNGASYFTFAKATPLNNGIVYLPDTIDYTVAYNTNCNVGAWVHYNKTGDPLHKLLGMSGFTTTELNNFAVTITPEGTSYDDGTRMSQLMPRIAYVANSNVAPLSTGKVRVYYSTEEMNRTILPGAVSNRWYKYEGNADEVLIDLYNDGLLAGSKAVALTPAASGTENGVNYVEFHNISSFSSFVFLSSSEIVPLPVKSLDFIARGQYGKALLEWSTLGAENVGSFEVERSTDGNQWHPIAAVNAKSAATNSSEKLDYSYTDETPLAGNNYYRLKLQERNGQYEYSSVRRLLFGSAASVITVAPNPVSSEVLIKGLTGSNTITVSNVLGQVIMRTVINTGTCSMDLSQYKPGAYLICIRQENGSVSSHKIIKE